MKEDRFTGLDSESQILLILTVVYCWEPPFLVSEAVTPMAKAESETLGP